MIPHNAQSQRFITLPSLFLVMRSRPHTIYFKIISVHMSMDRQHVINNNMNMTTYKLTIKKNKNDKYKHGSEQIQNNMSLSHIPFFLARRQEELQVLNNHSMWLKHVIYMEDSQTVLGDVHLGQLHLHALADRHGCICVCTRDT